MDIIHQKQIGKLQDDYALLKADYDILRGCIGILNDQIAALRRKVDTHIGNDFREDPKVTIIPGQPENCLTCQQYNECFSGLDKECIFSK